MSFRRIIAHLLPALAYGGLCHAFAFGLLLTRYHGYPDVDIPGGIFYYFDICGQQWPTFPILVTLFSLLIVIPTLVALVVAWRRPIVPLESADAVTVHLITLLLSLLVNGVLCLAFALESWNRDSF